MKKMIFGMIFASLAATASIVFAQVPVRYAAIDLRSTDDCVIPKVDGERVPFPLRSANTKFELASGETYLLNGNLVASGGKVYLKVDFNTQPWLATAKMLAFPYLEVTSMNPAGIAQYAGKMVQVAVVADRDPNHSLHASEWSVNFILPPVYTVR